MESREPLFFSQIMLPEHDWGLSFPNDPPFTMIQLDIFGNEFDKVGIHYHGNREDINLSIILEGRDEDGTPIKARDIYFESSLAKLQANPSILVSHVKRWNSGDFAIAEYIIEESQVRQKHWNIYSTKNSVWIDIQFTKLNYRLEDESLFEDFLTSITFEETSIDSLIAIGDIFRTEEMYEEAIGYFGHLLRDKDFTRMSIEQKREMSMGLILSYFPLDFNRAMSVADYCIQEVDSSCPDFYYMKAILFCILKRPDKKNAVANLEKTLEYWDNRMGDDEFFNVHKNQAFQRIRKYKGFRAIEEKWPI